MTAPSAYTIAVCEAAADQRTACDLAERVLLEEIDWLDPEMMPGHVRWRGYDATKKFLAVRDVSNEARRRRIRVHGLFRSDRGKYDERWARLALRLFLDLEDSPDGVLLVRDTDDEKEERIASLEKARSSPAWTFSVVLATPHTKRECWALAGFEPADAEEEGRLRELRSELGFDPTLHAERLTAEGRKGKKNAKNVLKRLAPGVAREQACWQKTDLRVLAERGTGSLLAAFLETVSEVLVPLVR